MSLGRLTTNHLGFGVLGIQLLTTPSELMVFILERGACNSFLILQRGWWILRIRILLTNLVRSRLCYWLVRKRGSPQSGIRRIIVETKREVLVGNWISWLSLGLQCWNLCLGGHWSPSLLIWKPSTKWGLVLTDICMGICSLSKYIVFATRAQVVILTESEWLGSDFRLLEDIGMLLLAVWLDYLIRLLHIYPPFCPPLNPRLVLLHRI